MYIFGYIDPGAGSIFFQMLIAGAMGFAFLFRRVISAPFRYVKKKFMSSKK